MGRPPGLTWAYIMKCINCGKKSTQPLCNPCIVGGEKLEALLKEGLVLEYSDGSIEVLSLKQPKREQP